MPSLCEFSCKSLHQKPRHALHFELLLIRGALRSVDPRLNSGAGRGSVSLADLQSVSSRSSPSLRRAPELNAAAAWPQRLQRTASSPVLLFFPPIRLLAPRRDSGLKLKLGIRVVEAVNPRLAKINPTFHAPPFLSSCCTCPCGWQDPRCTSCLSVAREHARFRAH